MIITFQFKESTDSKPGKYRKVSKFGKHFAVLPHGPLLDLRHKKFVPFNRLLKIFNRKASMRFCKNNC